MGATRLSKGESFTFHGHHGRIKFEVFPVNGKMAKATVVISRGGGGSETVIVESTKDKPGSQVRSDVAAVKNNGPAEVWASD